VNLHCPACDQSADVENPGPDGLLRCPRCQLGLTRPGGAVLGRLALKRVTPESLGEAPVIIGAAMPEEPEVVLASQGARFGLALLAEDTALHRALIADGLVEHGLANEVVATEQGDRFITEATRLLLRNERIDLCILDLEMPRLSGYHAAIALRALELAFEVQPTPVLFFSARVCDEPLRRAMEEVGHAIYLHKAPATGPEEMFERLAQVLRTIEGRPALEG
jgi:CheY-like chemotaxis protein